MMDTEAERYEYDHVDAVIHYDHDSEHANPRSEDDWNMGVMFCAHRNYNLGDVQLNGQSDWKSQVLDHFDLGMKCDNCGKEVEQIHDAEYYHTDNPNADDYDSPWEEEDVMCGGKLIELSLDELIIKPLYLYDHSGITMSTSSAMFSAMDSHGWDWGTVGVIATTKAKVERMMEREVTDDEVDEWLNGEVKVYDLYLTGQVYGYTVEDKEGEELDSCWGFLGSDSVEDEAKSSAKYWNEKLDAVERSAKLPVVMGE